MTTAGDFAAQRGQAPSSRTGASSTMVPSTRWRTMVNPHPASSKSAIARCSRPRTSRRSARMSPAQMTCASLRAADCSSCRTGSSHDATAMTRRPPFPMRSMPAAPDTIDRAAGRNWSCWHRRHQDKSRPAGPDRCSVSARLLGRTAQRVPPRAQIMSAQAPAHRCRAAGCVRHRSSGVSPSDHA